MEDVSLDPELRSGRKRVAATIVAAHAAKHVYNAGQTSLIMPEIKLGLGLTRSQFGSLGTAASIGWWASSMVGGYLGDRFSNRAGLVIALALALMGGGFFLAGVAPNYQWMIVAIFLTGIGPALFHPPAIGELSRRFPDRRGFAVSLHGTGANVGEVMGAPIVAALLAFITWRELMKASVIPALAVAVAVWVLIPTRTAEAEPHVASAGRYFTSLLTLLKNRMMIVLIVAASLRSIGESAVGAFVPLYLRDDLEYSVTTVAIILSVAQIAGIVSQPVMGHLSDRVGRKPVLVVGTALVMLSAFAFSVARPGIQLFAAIVVKGAFSFSLHHIFVAAALDVARGVAQSTVVSLVYAAAFVGTFSPYIAGLVADRYGIHSAFIYGGVVLVLPTIILALSQLPGPADKLDPEPRKPSEAATR